MSLSFSILENIINFKAQNQYEKLFDIINNNLKIDLSYNDFIKIQKTRKLKVNDEYCAYPLILSGKYYAVMEYYRYYPHLDNINLNKILININSKKLYELLYKYDEIYYPLFLILFYELNNYINFPLYIDPISNRIIYNRDLNFYDYSYIVCIKYGYRIIENNKMNLKLILSNSLCLLALNNNLSLMNYYYDLYEKLICINYGCLNKILENSILSGHLDFYKYILDKFTNKYKINYIDILYLSIYSRNEECYNYCLNTINKNIFKDEKTKMDLLGYSLFDSNLFKNLLNYLSHDNYNINKLLIGDNIEQLFSIACTFGYVGSLDIILKRICNKINIGTLSYYILNNLNTFTYFYNHYKYNKNIFNKLNFYSKLIVNDLYFDEKILLFITKIKNNNINLEDLAYNNIFNKLSKGLLLFNKLYKENNKELILKSYKL